MLWIVLEYVEGGELFDAVKIMHHQVRVTESNVNEFQVKHLFLQVLHAVQWLHDHNIVHRDLKLESKYFFFFYFRELQDSLALRYFDSQKQRKQGRLENHRFRSCSCH